MDRTKELEREFVTVNMVDELIGMKRNYQHLLSKKWMLALALTKCINRDVRRGWKKNFSLMKLSSLLLMKKDFVVRKIKKRKKKFSSV